MYDISEEDVVNDSLADRIDAYSRLLVKVKSIKDAAVRKEAMEMLSVVRRSIRTFPQAAPAEIKYIRKMGADK